MSAQSLDQVHSATWVFFDTMCSFCNLVPPAAAGSRRQAAQASGQPAPAPATMHQRFSNGVRQQLEALMDAALAAAAAAGRVHAARQKLSELQVGGCRSSAKTGRGQGVNPWYACLPRCCMASKPEACLPHMVQLVCTPRSKCDTYMSTAAASALPRLQRTPGREAAMQQWWRELASGRSTLFQAGVQWRKGLDTLLSLFTVLEKHNTSHAFEELKDVLDMNGYFGKLSAKTGTRTSMHPFP